MARNSPKMTPPAIIFSAEAARELLPRPKTLESLPIALTPTNTLVTIMLCNRNRSKAPSWTSSHSGVAVSHELLLSQVHPFEHFVGPLVSTPSAGVRQNMLHSSRPPVRLREGCRFLPTKFRCKSIRDGAALLRQRSAATASSSSETSLRLEQSRKRNPSGCTKGQLEN